MLIIDYRAPGAIKWHRALRNPATGRFLRNMRLGTFLAYLEKEGYEVLLVCDVCRCTTECLNARVP